MHRAIFLYIVWGMLAILAYVLYRNRMSPKVLETCLTILLLVIAVVFWQLKSEKSETKITFVYFFDWQEGKFIDLKVPGLYYPETFLTIDGEGNSLFQKCTTKLFP